MIRKLFEKFFLKKNTENNNLKQSIETVLDSDLRGTEGISKHERLMLLNILKIDGIRSSDIMIPRADIGAVELNDRTSGVEKENVMNLLQVAIKPLHVAMKSNPDLYRQAWPPEIIEILLKTVECYKKAPFEEDLKDTHLAKVFKGGHDDVWGIILSFLASHNDAPRLRQKLAEESETVQAQDAVGVGRVSPEQVSVAP